MSLAKFLLRIVSPVHQLPETAALAWAGAGGLFHSWTTDRQAECIRASYTELIPQAKGGKPSLAHHFVLCGSLARSLSLPLHTNYFTLNTHIVYTASCHKSPLRVPIKPTNFKLYLFLFIAATLVFLPNIGPSHQRLPGKGEMELLGAGVIFLPRNVQRKVGVEATYTDHCNISFSCVISTWYDSAVLHCLLSFPTCNLHRQKHMGTHVSPRRELLAIIHYLVSTCW